MANKYIIHGATYNGDGTSSAEATSNGGVGAWKDINILTGAATGFGSIAAGDVVYIRSKSAAGADISVSANASQTFGVTSGTASLPVVWVLDGGVVWPGVDGSFTYTVTAGGAITLRNYNNFVSQKKHKWILSTTMTQDAFVYFQNTYVNNLLIEHSAQTGGFSGSLAVSGAGFYPVIENVRYVAPKGYVQLSNECATRFLNFEIQRSVVSAQPIFNVAGSVGSLQVFGGRFYGAGATTGAYLLGHTASSSARLIGFTYPNSVAFSNALPVYRATLDSIGADSSAGAVSFAPWGTLDSRNDGNYPTLNAALPNSVSTPWSWKIYPQAASWSFPVEVTSAKYFTDTPAIKTITVEILVANGYVGGINKANCWIAGSYTDETTGGVVSFSTLEIAPTPAALDSSSASWSALTYGPISFTKKKISFTTPTAIKKDTLVTVQLLQTFKSSSANDITFVCPDVSLT